MSFSHVHTRTVSGPAGGPYTNSVTVTASAESNLSETVAGGATNVLHNWACDVSALKSLLIKCDRDITLYTNDLSSGTPDDTITIKANNPLSWDSNCGLACPITVDVTTGLYVTLAAGASATLIICALQDATP